MTKHTECPQSKSITSTDLFEDKGETSWNGHSKGSPIYLLEQAMKAPREPRPDKRDGEELQTYYNGSSHFSKQINSVVSNVPVSRNSLSQVEIFQVLQEWEGRVLSVGEDTFTARLIDIENNPNHEEGDFFIKDVRNDDLKLLKPGAIFRWVVGTVVKQDRTEHCYSDIVFRRLSKWSHGELSEADKEARNLSRTIDWQ